MYLRLFSFVKLLTYDTAMLASKTPDVEESNVNK